MENALETLELEPDTRRVALFGGVYNNHLALESLIEDAGRYEAEHLFCLGDIGGFGPHPDRSFPLLREAGIRTMAGNYDVSIAGELDDCGCGYSDPRDNHFAQISYAYTLSNTSRENRSWLGGLPRAIRFRLGGKTVHLCHGSPRRTNEFLWETTSPDHLLERFCDQVRCDILCCTHTGIKWQRRLPSGRLVVNVGVIGRPENDGGTGVWYTLVEAGPEGVGCRFLPLSYDHDRLAGEMRAEGLPAEFVQTILTGWWTTCLEIMPGKERRRGRY